MKEYDIYLPLTYNDGTPIYVEAIDQIGVRLLKRFGGVTFFPQPNQGMWKMGEVVFRDQIVVFRVLTENVKSARRFLGKLKEQLKVDLEQEEILIVEKSARAL